MPFHVEKSGVFIGPIGFKIGAKKCHIPGFRGTSGTIVITGRYYHLQSNTRWYHHLVWVVPLPIELWRYHRLTGAVPPLVELTASSTIIQTTLEIGTPKRCHRRPWFQGLNGLFNLAQFNLVKGPIGS